MINGKKDKLLEKREKWHDVRKDRAAYQYVKSKWDKRRILIKSWIIFRQLLLVF